MKEKLNKKPVRLAICVCLAAVTLFVSMFATGSFSKAPAPASENGIVTEAQWAEMFPELVATYEANADNDYIVDYLAEDPYLVNIYEGYGFAKMYGSARGHSYCLEDVNETARPHALANCLTCKTADLTKLVNDLGEEAYSMSFEEVFPMMNSSVGCYNCHANEAYDGGKIVITHDYVVENLANYEGKVDDAILSCGQCHIEYYFKPDTKATSVPYTSLDDMSPDAMLAYYNEIGFADWTQESTGTKMLKAQHPEFETFTGSGSKHFAFGLTCADCHMATVKAADGSEFKSHYLESPLNNEALLASCTQCHGDTDMAEKVHTLQAQIVARETETGNKLSALKDKLAAANQSGKYSESELDAIRQLYREAQWFFDFDYVENSEGAHNSTLANYCLDKAEELIAEANKLFK